MGEAILTNTHNLCFEQKYEKYQNFLSENFHFFVVIFSIYLNRRVFVMVLVRRPYNPSYCDIVQILLNLLGLYIICPNRIQSC